MTNVGLSGSGQTFKGKNEINLVDQIVALKNKLELIYESSKRGPTHKPEAILPIAEPIVSQHKRQGQG